MSVDSKTFKNLLLWNKRTDDLATLYVTSGSLTVRDWSNSDIGLTVTFFTARSNIG